LRALNLELFTLPSKSDFLRERQSGAKKYFYQVKCIEKTDLCVKEKYQFIHKTKLQQYKLVRFAHNWNVGILEHWNIGFWENGKMGYCKIPLDGN